ncbi:hypothetical protein [Pseudonocardia humida]|uniref:Uncharacterized protein n=1 Tax=Pseudonocardia humida TaxID=2800819 RepID=A0ABT1A417_9PSEU|nr:hypothetical protein [Pseudonocardia humida]MCO1657584.1 hypothetical protein [Pseudonocardia humida]
MSTRTAVAAARCRCGHDVDAHEHFRAGRDCSTCGPEVCRRYSGRPGAGLPAVLRLGSQPTASRPVWTRLRARG